MKRLSMIAISAAFIGLMAFPAFGLDTPQAVQSLSSAGTPVGQALLGPTGQALLDASGRPLTVLSVQTEPAQATAVSLAALLKMPIGDLIADAQAVGISLPMITAGSMTTVTRSDGGIEKIFAYTGANGDTCVFLADQTGPNVYGIRIADVQANGMGSVLTAHGLNGNFTSPPWYLSKAAKQNYWINTQTTQVFIPAPSTPTPVPLLANSSTSSSARGTGMICYTSDYATGNQTVSLSGSRHRQQQMMALVKRLR